MSEHWLPIVDGYEVSDQGRVRSTVRGKPVILKGTLRKWATSKDNHADRKRHGSAYTDETIAAILNHRRAGKTYREIADLTGVSIGTAHRVANLHKEDQCSQ